MKTSEKFISSFPGTRSNCGGGDAHASKRMTFRLKNDKCFYRNCVRSPPTVRLPPLAQSHLMMPCYKNNPLFSREEPSFSRQGP